MHYYWEPNFVGQNIDKMISWSIDAVNFLKAYHKENKEFIDGFASPRKYLVEFLIGKYLEKRKNIEDWFQENQMGLSGLAGLRE